MEDQRFRHEWKHVISPADCAILRSRLRVLLPADQNGDSNGRYYIRSLYFDNPEDKVLREKLDGVSNRDKYRIRYYNHDPGFIKLEKKSKRNGLCRKDSVRVSAEEAQRIVHGDWKWTESSEKRLLRDLFFAMLYSGMVPKTVVDYTREAFVYPAGNVRIALDQQIRTGLDATDFLNPQLPTIPAGNDIILEIKYDSFLPDFIRDAVQLDSRRSSAFSKYAAARYY